MKLPTVPVHLAQIKTRDGVTLDGAVVLPARKGNTVVVWLHGLSSKFYTGQPLIRELSQRLTQKGIGHFKFNNRGHDIAVKSGKNYTGSAFEKFEDCVHDIRAVIRFAKRLGFQHIILAGHSTGANKALYYIYKTRDRAVKGLMLLSPMNDLVGEIRMIGAKKLRQAVAIAQRLNKKHPEALMPQRYGLYTARRYLSLYRPGSREDVFPYYNPKARWKELKSVKIPLAVVIGSRDKFRDRPAKKLVEVFRANAVRASSFTGIVIPGAPHGFQKREKELTRAVVRWISAKILK